MRRALLAITVAAVSAVGAALAGCTATAADDGRISVVAGFYPLQFVAERVGGDAVTVTSLAQPGAEPHDLELSPQQVAKVADADLVLSVRGFQPALDAAIAQQAPDASLDVSTTVSLLESSSGEPDPHLWLDPTRLATITLTVANRLATLDPAHADEYRQRGAELIAELSALDTRLAEGLATCQRREIVTSHAAFGYLADRYHLRQIPITGLSPEVEPTPRELADAADQARQAGATTIFFETLVSPRVAEAVAGTIGATTAVLDPIEGLEPGSTGDYLTVMASNLDVLRPALGCA